jgi:hypothetical protein
VVTGEGDLNASSTTPSPQEGSTEASRSDESPLLFLSSPWASSRHARDAEDAGLERPRRTRNDSDLITVEVQADRVSAFSFRAVFVCLGTHKPKSVNFESVKIFTL